MYISKPTLAILKNFAQFKDCMYLSQGYHISNITTDRAAYVTARIEDYIDEEVGIYNLSHFLRVLSTFRGDKIELKVLDCGNRFMVSDDHGSCTFNLPNRDYVDFKVMRSDPKTGQRRMQYILTRQTIPVSKLEENLEFFVDEEFFKRVRAAATATCFKDIHISAKNGKLAFTLKNMKDPTSLIYSLGLESSFDESEAPNDGDWYMSCELFNMIDPKRKYKVRIHESGNEIYFESEDMIYRMSLIDTDELDKSHESKDD